MLPPTPAQLYLVCIRFRRKIPFLRLLIFLNDLKSTIEKNFKMNSTSSKEQLSEKSSFFCSTPTIKTFLSGVKTCFFIILQGTHMPLLFSSSKDS